MVMVDVLQEGVLRLVALAGDVARLFGEGLREWKPCSIDERMVAAVVEAPGVAREEWKAHVQATTRRMVLVLGAMCDEMGFDLCKIVVSKMDLNAARYPPGPAGYVGKDVKRWKTRTDNAPGREQRFEIAPCRLEERKKKGWNKVCFDRQLGELKEKVRNFAAQRGLGPRYNPLSLTLALASEVGELAGSLQWLASNMAADDLEEARIGDVLEEVADVAIYCLHIENYEVPEEGRGTDG